jgi:hypothetical protein
MNVLPQKRKLNDDVVSTANVVNAVSTFVISGAVQSSSGATVEFTPKELKDAGIYPECTLLPIITLPFDTTVITLSLLEQYVTTVKPRI